MLAHTTLHSLFSAKHNIVVLCASQCILQTYVNWNILLVHNLCCAGNRSKYQMHAQDADDCSLLCCIKNEIKFQQGNRR